MILGLIALFGLWPWLRPIRFRTFDAQTGSVKDSFSAPGYLSKLRIYAVSVKARRPYVEQELRRIGANYTVINAITSDSELVTWYLWHMDLKEIEHQYEKGIGGYWPGPKSRGVTACLLSHLSALKALIDDAEADAGIVLEDDVALLLDRALLWKRIGRAYKLLDRADVVRLSYLNHPTHIRPEVYDEFVLNGTWSGSQAYMISKSYAKLVVDTIDHP